MLYYLAINHDGNRGLSYSLRYCDPGKFEEATSKRAACTVPETVRPIAIAIQNPGPVIFLSRADSGADCLNQENVQHVE